MKTKTNQINQFIVLILSQPLQAQVAFIDFQYLLQKEEVVFREPITLRVAGIMTPIIIFNYFLVVVVLQQEVVFQHLCIL